MKNYIYQGDGAGIPGLPREISEEEIQQMSPDQAQTWKAAIESGSYVEVIEHLAVDPSTPRKSKPTKPAQPADEGEQP